MRLHIFCSCFWRIWIGTYRHGKWRALLWMACSMLQRWNRKLMRNIQRPEDVIHEKHNIAKVFGCSRPNCRRCVVIMQMMYAILIDHHMRWQPTYQPLRLSATNLQSVIPQRRAAERKKAIKSQGTKRTERFNTYEIQTNGPTMYDVFRVEWI